MLEVEKLRGPWLAEGREGRGFGWDVMAGEGNGSVRFVFLRDFDGLEAKTHPFLMNVTIRSAVGSNARVCQAVGCGSPR
jgi:hypothetical protein